jgi:hypothetical protein
MLCVMGEDKEAQQQVALKTQREPLMVRLGERISAAENIYIRLCRVPCIYTGPAYCFFDKICVSAFDHAPIILASAVTSASWYSMVITPLLEVA